MESCVCHINIGIKNFKTIGVSNFDKVICGY